MSSIFRPGRVVAFGARFEGGHVFFEIGALGLLECFVRPVTQALVLGFGIMVLVTNIFFNFFDYIGVVIYKFFERFALLSSAVFAAHILPPPFSRQDCFPACAADLPPAFCPVGRGPGLLACRAGLGRCFCL